MSKPLSRYLNYFKAGIEENEEEEEAVCGRVTVHSHAAKIEVITEKILEINTRGDSRIKKKKRAR